MQTDQKKTHILVTTSWIPTEKHPFLGNFILQFANEMSSKVQITFLLFSPSNCNSITISREEKFGVQCLIVEHPESKVIGQRKALKAAASHLIGQNIDLIHHHVSVTKWWMPLYLKRKLNCPVIVTEHASIFLNGRFDQLSPIMKFGVKKLYNSANAVVAVSEQLKNALPKSRKNKSVIPNLLPDQWLSSDLVRPSNETYQLLHISTVDANKRADGIIRAYHAAIQKITHPSVLTIVSDESTASLKKLCKTLNIEKHVRFVGPTEHAALLDIYREHHCFILNSEFETFSIVNAEALACGLHLITTPVGFAAELGKSENIDIVSINDQHELEAAIVKAIQLQKYGGSESRSLVEHFAASEVTNQYLELYQSTISANPS